MRCSFSVKAIRHIFRKRCGICSKARVALHGALGYDKSSRNKGEIVLRDYASLQLPGVPASEEARARLIYSITAYLDAQGFISCTKEAAERTVAFVRTDKGWAVFDDCAERLDTAALNGLGRCLSGKLRTQVVGLMGSGTGLMLCLYAEGLVRDMYITSRRPFGRTCLPGWLNGRGHAPRWRAQLAEGVEVKELAALFAKGRREGRAIYERLSRALDLDETAAFGFSSIEEAGLQGVVTLYFRAANVVRQGLFDRLLHPARPAASTPGACLRIERKPPDRLERP